MKDLVVVIDTNVLVGMFNNNHANAEIRKAWQKRRIIWAISTDILAEYEEIMCRFYGSSRATEVLGIILQLGLLANSVIRVSPSYFFRTIPSDRDDDKFADCAIAANADYIITSDKHFANLRGSGYKPQPIRPEDFISEVQRAG
jgi:putative PIN family toxin of toxin-antitoxin system